MGVTEWWRRITGKDRRESGAGTARAGKGEDEGFEDRALSWWTRLSMVKQLAAGEADPYTASDELLGLT